MRNDGLGETTVTDERKREKKGYPSGLAGLTTDSANRPYGLRTKSKESGYPALRAVRRRETRSTGSYNGLVRGNDRV